MKIRKKISILLLILVFLAVLIMPPFVYAEKSASRTIRVGFFDFDGFQEYDADTSTRSGYGYDYLQALANYNGWTYEYVDGKSFAECVEMLKNGEIDIVGSLQKSAERMEYLDFADLESGISYVAIFVKADNLGYALDDFDDFDGIHIGLLDGNSRNSALEIFAENKFTYTTTLFDGQSEMLKALDDGIIDAVLLSTVSKLTNYRIIAQFNPSPFYFATTKGNTQVLSELNYAMKKIKTSNPYFDIELREKHYGPMNGSVIAFTADELEYLRTNPTVVVGYDSNWYPLEYKNESNEFCGFMREIFNVIKASVTLPDGSGTINFDYRTDADFNTVVQNFIKGDYDMLSTLGNDSAYGVINNSKLTETVLSSSIDIVENVESKSDVMLLPRGYYITKIIAQKFSDVYKIEYADTISDCFDALLHGTAKYTAVNTHIANALLQNADYKYFTARTLAGFTEDVSMAVYDNATPELYSIINKALAYISSQEKSAILFRITGNTAKYGLKDYFYSNPEEAIAIFVSALAIIITISICMIVVQSRNKKAMYKRIIYDKLTGLYVKQGFIYEVEKLLHNNPDSLYVLIYFNLVQFKVVNELFGFHTGDMVLKYCAELIQENAGTEGICARVEGDRFLVCMQYSKMDLASIETIEDKLAGVVKGIKISTKSGIYVAENRDLSVTAMCDRALLALKQAQRLQNKKYCFYDERLKLAVLEEQEVLSNFEAALSNREFVVYYQPIVSLTEKRAVCAEALVRWQHPKKGTVSPGVFIPALENNGLIAELDYYVWEEVFKYARSRIDRERPPMTYSINLSRVHLFSTKFIDVLVGLSEKYNISPDLFRVEVTESAYTQDTRYFVERLSMLKHKGFKVAMDDFGSGYSSLNALSEFPLDIVKLDTAFFNSKKKARSNSIIMSTIQMLHNIGISVIAEGVETREQAELLYSLGCDSIQGYYFYKPMPIEDFEKADNTPIEIGSREIMKNRNRIEMDMNQLKNIENFKGMDTIVQAIPCGFGVYCVENDKSRALFMSRGIENFLGYDENQGYELCKDDIAHIIHQDDLRVVYDGINRALNNKVFFEEEFRMKAVDGAYKWVSFRANAVEINDNYSLWYGVYTNIDSYRKANEKLQSTANYYKNLFDTMNCGVVRYLIEENQYQMLSINKAGSKIYGYKTQTDCIKNFNLNTATFEEDMAYRADIVRQAKLSSDPIPYEYRLNQPSGHVVWIKGYLQCQRGDNNENVYQSSFINVTGSNYMTETRFKEQFLNLILDSFDNVYFLNYDTDSAKVLASKLEPSLKNKSSTISELTMRLVETYAMDKFKREIYQNLTLDNLRNYDFDKPLKFQYQILINDEPHNVVMAILKIDASKYLVCNKIK